MRGIIWFMAFVQMGSCTEASRLQDEPNLIAYESSSRGYFYRIEVNSESVKVYEDRSMAQSKEQELKPEQWQDLLKLLDKIPIDELGDLEVSTTQSATDRSAIAAISIRKGTHNYESAAFDANTPPEKLKPLITLMRTLAETVE
ncbi:MAG: hypothetical protein KJO20_09875 [Eudoraea sp.]|nr:hypothetical protein [Eudoraea sp.]NNK30379.1 hypothetical protein [Flavobacteriaceae bacterium]